MIYFTAGNCSLPCYLYASPQKHALNDFQRKMKNEDLLTNALTDMPKKWFLEYVSALGCCQRQV